MSRDPRLFLQDILNSAAKVLSYTAGMSQEAIEANGLAYDAMIRNLEAIGEARQTDPSGTSFPRTVVPAAPSW